MTIEFFDVRLPVWAVRVIIRALKTAYEKTEDCDFSDALPYFTKALTFAENHDLSKVTVHDIDDYTPEVVKRALHVAMHEDPSFADEYLKALQTFALAFERSKEG